MSIHTALLPVFVFLALAATGARAASLDPASFNAAVGVQLDVCAAATISGALRYVSPTGDDDAADGSAAHPYKTVYRAVQDAQPGETVVLRQGTYVEPLEPRVTQPNVTIRSQPGEWAVVDRRTGGEEDSGIYFYVDADGGALECLEVVGGFYAVSIETRWDWGDPDDRTGASHIRLENAKLHGSSRDVVKIKPNCDDVTIRHCEIYDSGQGQDPTDCNAEGIDNVNGDRTIVAYNHIHDICSTGVYLKGGATDGLIEYNRIERVGAAGILLGFDTSPEYFDLTANPGYYENIRGVARHNLVVDAKWAGIGFYAAKDAKAYANTIAQTAQTYHSPIYFGVTYQDWDPDAGRPASTGVAVYGNIAAQPGTLSQPLAGIRYSSDLGGLSGLSGKLDIHDQCYWREAGAAMFEDGRTSFLGDFAAWRSHIGAEAGSVEENPLFDAQYKPGNPACADKGHLAVAGGAQPAARLLLPGEEP